MNPRAQSRSTRRSVSSIYEPSANFYRFVLQNDDRFVYFFVNILEIEI
jgi:hypothetical protein